jgi:hypothetical protein
VLMIISPLLIPFFIIFNLYFSTQLLFFWTIENVFSHSFSKDSFFGCQFGYSKILNHSVRCTACFDLAYMPSRHMLQQIEPPLSTLTESHRDSLKIAGFGIQKIYWISLTLPGRSSYTL